MTQRPPASKPSSSASPDARRPAAASGTSSSSGAPRSSSGDGARREHESQRGGGVPPTQRSLRDGVRQLTMSTADRASLLENSRWFQSVAFTYVHGLAEYLAAISVAPGTYIFEEGDTEPYLGIVVSGAIDIVKADTSSELKTLGTITPGRSFGEMSLIERVPRSASAFSKSATIVLVLSQSAFVRLLDEKPNLGVQLLLALCKLTSQRLRQTSGRLVDFLES